MAFNGAKLTFFDALDLSAGLRAASAVLTDEFTASGGSEVTDARYTSAAVFKGNGVEVGDTPLQQLYNARSSFLLAAIAMRRYEPDSGQAKVGEAYALVGYIELFMAEDYCAGVTLSYVPDDGGIVYGRPLTTDSLLATAEAHFDSALGHAGGDAMVQALARVGLGRARLNRAHYAQAAAAVTGVPTSFVYNVTLWPHLTQGLPNFYTVLALGQCAYMTVADGEGMNGLNFISAHDARLVFDTTVNENCNGKYYGLADSLFYYPTKFGNPPTGFVPLATGVEARLIEAEAALASGATGAWAANLNALRAVAPSSYLALDSPMGPLTADSTTGANAAMQNGRHVPRTGVLDVRDWRSTGRLASSRPTVPSRSAGGFSKWFVSAWPQSGFGGCANSELRIGRQLHPAHVVRERDGDEPVLQGLPHLVGHGMSTGRPPSRRGYRP